VGRVTVLAVVLSAIVGACGGSTTEPSAVQRANASSDAGAKRAGVILAFVAGDSVPGDSSGLFPLAQALVQMYRVDSAGHRSLVAADSTGPGGTFKFTHVAAGTYFFFANAPIGSPYIGDSAAHLVTSSGSGTVHVRIILPLAPVDTASAGRIAGVVKGETVAGDTSSLVLVAGAKVSLFRDDSTGHETPLGVDTSATGGTFTFAHVSAGTYTLSATPPVGTKYTAGSTTIGSSGSGSTNAEIILPLPPH
jgi:hypothetical protein